MNGIVETSFARMVRGVVTSVSGMVTAIFAYQQLGESVTAAYTCAVGAVNPLRISSGIWNDVHIPVSLACEANFESAMSLSSECGKTILKNPGVVRPTINLTKPLVIFGVSALLGVGLVFTWAYYQAKNIIAVNDELRNIVERDDLVEVIHDANEHLSPLVDYEMEKYYKSSKTNEERAQKPEPEVDPEIVLERVLRIRDDGWLGYEDEDSEDSESSSDEEWVEMERIKTDIEKAKTGITDRARSFLYITEKYLRSTFDPRFDADNADLSLGFGFFGFSFMQMIHVIMAWRNRDVILRTVRYERTVQDQTRELDLRPDLNCVGDVKRKNNSVDLYEITSYSVKKRFSWMHFIGIKLDNLYYVHTHKTTIAVNSELVANNFVLRTADRRSNISNVHISVKTAVQNSSTVNLNRANTMYLRNVQQGSVDLIMHMFQREVYTMSIDPMDF